MIKLTVRILANGHSRKLTDYILPQKAEKLRNCCAACGILGKYDDGVVSEDDFPGKRGRLTLTVEKKRGYDPRNVIADDLTDEVA